MEARFNYYYNGQSITKKQFEATVPSDWQENLNEFGEYSYGYFRAVCID